MPDIEISMPVQTGSETRGQSRSRTLTRVDLAEAVYQRVGLSRKESAALVQAVLTELSDRLVEGEPVKLSSFGSFVVRAKGERIGPQSKDRRRSADHPAACHGVQAVERAEGPDQWTDRAGQ